MDAKKKFEKFLKKRGLKFTRPRIKIFSKVICIKKHFSAEDLYLSLQDAELPKISRATVYRTLAILLEANIIDALDFGESCRLYEFISDCEHHDHIISLDNDEIIEFHSDELEKLQNEIVSNLGYNVVNHSLKIYVTKKDKKIR